MLSVTAIDVILEYDIRLKIPTRLQRRRFVECPVFSVRYSVALINSSLLTVSLHSMVRATLVYNDTTFSVPFMTL